MKCNIVVQIDCENERCGECRRVYEDEKFCPWSLIPACNNPSMEMFRGHECLAAERKLKALVAAGEAMRRHIVSTGNAQHCDAWDRAIAALVG